MHVADHLTLLQLQELASAEPSKRRFLRLRALILARSGMTAFEVAHALGVARRSVQNWVARYNNEGLTGLNNRPGGGRPAFLYGSCLVFALICVHRYETAHTLFMTLAFRPTAHIPITAASLRASQSA